MSLAVRCLLAVVFATVFSPNLSGQEPKKQVIPHAQDKPPNEPRDPQTAAKMMTVPEGFSVEVVAAEPNIVNPVAMAIDERGRFWITESLEYPRKSTGPGQDRVKVLEDTDGDGKMDKFTVFMEGLNIPSGIAVGHGGVWVANSPDILFVQDTDGDGKADKQEVVVTGFGRTDTHELPNSLTWGPDGWLYGLNGVFNYSHVTYPPESPWLKGLGARAEGQGASGKGQDSSSVAQPSALGPQREFKFTCAMFRIHPRTREFQIFCEGTSNPWGIAFNDEGEAFVSACVIDHLWHLVETGYYHRQGGPYPPFTWKIDSIVKHKHQKAAYCGIHYFDSDAYPEQYRGKLYMGNIHGGCINVDRIEGDGSTYKGFGEPDFLTANDAWFMPVVQKTGPDGCLYILDWYDRYHCYQDANRDPAGIDRLKGRLYRVRYKDSPRSPKGFDLAKDTDEQLIERLGAKNDFIRWTATRLLQERSHENARRVLIGIVGNASNPLTMRQQALFSLAGMPTKGIGGGLLGISMSINAAGDEQRTLKAWVPRICRNDAMYCAEVASEANENRNFGFDLQKSSASEVLQKVILLGKIPSQSPKLLEGFVRGLSHFDDDKLIPHIVWQNLSPRLEDQADDFVNVLRTGNHLRSEPVAQLMPRVVDRILGRQKFDAKPVAQLFALLRDDHHQVGRQVLEVISAKVQSGELKGEKLDQLKVAMAEPLTPLLAGRVVHPLTSDAALLAASWGDQRGLPHVRQSFSTSGLPADLRLKSLNALIAAKDEEVLHAVAKVFNSKSEVSEFKSQILLAIGRLEQPRVAEIVLAEYSKLDPELQPKAIELLTQRASWAKPLLAAVGDKKIAAAAINLNQAQRLVSIGDKDLAEAVRKHWGTVRTGRSPEREALVAEMKTSLRQSKGDPFAGEKVFERVCGQCHKIYGKGADVGPEITLNGRNDYHQLISNVFDPSLVIGAAYQAMIVATTDGRVLTGLPVENSDQRIVLKMQGGKLETIARADIDEFRVSELSMMPEQLEKQIKPDEMADLFAFLVLDKHPSDKSAKRLPGSVAAAPRETRDPKDFPAIVAEVLPGFSTTASGELGIGIVKEHLGRDGVLRTHPVNKDQPCVLSMKLTPPADKKTKLILDVAHDARGDWRLVVRGNGQRMADEMISKETCSNGWRTITVDLSKFAGQELKLDLVNQANDWSYEFAYWGGARIVSE